MGAVGAVGAVAVAVEAPTGKCIPQSKPDLTPFFAKSIPTKKHEQPSVPLCAICLVPAPL